MRAVTTRSVSVLAVALALGATGSALASEVTGKLLLASYRPEEKAPERPASLWEIENGVKEVAPDRIDARRELAVVLVGEGAAQVEDRLEVTCLGGNLMPSTIVVRAGTTLLVRNDDEIAHELFADGVAGFSAEATSPRGRRSVALKDAGAFTVRDRLVPHAEAFVHVLPNLIAVAKISSSGDISFGDVAPGTYTLKVFHGPSEIASQSVEVGARPLTLEPLAFTPSGDK